MEVKKSIVPIYEKFVFHDTKTVTANNDVFISDTQQLSPLVYTVSHLPPVKST